MNLNIWLVLAIGTLTFLTIVIALIVLVMVGKQRELKSKECQLEELAKKERKYRNLFENSLAGMVRLVVDSWDVIDANRTLLEMLGVKTPEEIKKFLQTIPDTDRDKLLSTLKNQGKIKNFETSVRRANNSEVQISFSGSLFPQEGFIEGVIIDITERKRLEARFLRAQRVESIGIFASGIAHDLSNTLAPVLIGVNVLKKKLRDQRSRRLLKTIESSAKHGTEMVYQVLSFVKGVEGARLKINPRKIVKDIIGLLPNIVPESVSIHTQIADKISPIMGDATQLHQVLINLCVNARDAMPQGGELTFSAEEVWVNKEIAEEHNDALEGQYVVFSVSDTGSGIPQSELHKIFEPFYTTKEIGKGTGLGLSICLGIIKGHKGFMTVDSEEGKGSTFKIFLPVMSDANMNMQESETPVDLNQQIIFAALSEEDYSHTLFEELESCGLEPLFAVGISQVKEMLLQSPGKVQVMVMDGFLYNDTPIMMEDILKLEPQARFVILVEKSQMEEIEGIKLPKPHILLEKPASVKSLLEQIQRLTSHELKSE
jgi:PAS domain S-box-containing protein